MTLAELKRQAKAGILVMEMTERYGSTGEQIPERLRGKRQVIGANSVAIMLRNANGETSEMRIDSAKLIDYDGKTLTVYAAARREPTEAEQRELDRYKKALSEHQRRNPYSESYWFTKDFWKRSEYPWLDGYEIIQGKRYEHHSGKVMDRSIKGEPILKYTVTISDNPQPMKEKKCEIISTISTFIPGFDCKQTEPSFILLVSDGEKCKKIKTKVDEYGYNYFTFNHKRYYVHNKGSLYHPDCEISKD